MWANAHGLVMFLDLEQQMINVLLSDKEAIGTAFQCSHWQWLVMENKLNDRGRKRSWDTWRNVVQAPDKYFLDTEEYLWAQAPRNGGDPVWLPGTLSCIRGLDCFLKHQLYLAMGWWLAAEVNPVSLWLGLVWGCIVYLGAIFIVRLFMDGGIKET